jgi:hypothetical protein
VTSREELHNSAVKVIDEYENEGKPLVLYLRKFDITVLHGKNAINRYLTENYIASHLPQGINIITIQDQDDITYDLPGGTAFSRRVPSLLLDDSEWKNW